MSRPVSRFAGLAALGPLALGPVALVVAALAAWGGAGMVTEARAIMALIVLAIGALLTYSGATLRGYDGPHLLVGAITVLTGLTATVLGEVAIWQPAHLGDPVYDRVAFAVGVVAVFGAHCSLMLRAQRPGDSWWTRGSGALAMCGSALAIAGLLCLDVWFEPGIAPAGLRGLLTLLEVTGGLTLATVVLRAVTGRVQPSR